MRLSWLPRIGFAEHLVSDVALVQWPEIGNAGDEEMTNLDA